MGSNCEKIAGIRHSPWETETVVLTKYTVCICIVHVFCVLVRLPFLVGGHSLVVLYCIVLYCTYGTAFLSVVR